MSDTRQKVKDDVAKAVIAMAEPAGGILELGKQALKKGNVDENSDAAKAIKNAAKAADKHKDKNGKVDPAIQAIYARIYGLI